MNVQVELWQLMVFLAGLLVSFFGCIFAFGRLLMGQFEKRLDERFGAQDLARALLAAEVAKIKDAQHAQEVVFLKFQATLPEKYEAREDVIRKEAVFHAKLDSLATMLMSHLRITPPNGST